METLSCSIICHISSSILFFLASNFISEVFEIIFLILFSDVSEYIFSRMFLNTFGSLSKSGYSLNNCINIYSTLSVKELSIAFFVLLAGEFFDNKIFIFSIVSISVLVNSFSHEVSTFSHSHILFFKSIIFFIN